MKASLQFVWILVVCAAVGYAPATEFSWQQPHARVLPTGNLEWSPRPFVYEPGETIRYIDYENGNDANPGTKAAPWKHHPWDSNAEGSAKSATGIDTFVFKQGVIYRGGFDVRESGRPDRPIRLTVDPEWGTGEACIYGSVKITSGWERVTTKAVKKDEGAVPTMGADDLFGADDDDGGLDMIAETLDPSLKLKKLPNIPDPHTVWYNDLGKDFDRDRKGYQLSAMWRVDGASITRQHIARDPNWHISDPDDPTSEWYRWEKFQGFMNRGTFWDTKHLKHPTEPRLLDDAVIWTQHAHLMGTPHRVKPQRYNPVAGSLQISSPGGADYGNARDKPRSFGGRVRYFVENVAMFLDEPGEYFYQVDGHYPGRLYLRPENGEDPNTHAYEIALVRCPIQIFDKHDVVVSGLTFRFNDPSDGLYGYPRQIGCSPGVRMVGNCTNITVKNCRFYHMANAVVAFPRPNASGGPYGVWRQELGDFADDVMHNIVITDNDAQHIEKGGAIFVVGASEKAKGAPYGRLVDVRIMRNRVINSGFRPGSSPTSSIPAISCIVPETLEIAGNIVDTSWGNGIFTLGGKHSGAFNVVPLTRMLIYQNQIDNTMLGCNDYGGLEHFQGGPYYCFNNITRNAVGTKTFTGGELAYNLYLDGGFKCYSFNNIIGGKAKPDKPNYYSHCGYFMVFGFLDHLFNNTIVRFEYGLNGSSGNRSCILGNVMADCSKSFMGQNRPGDASMMGGGDTGEMGRKGVPTMVYGNNVFYGTPTGGYKGLGAFGFVGGTKTGVDGDAEVYTGETLEELSTRLKEMKCRVSSIGWHEQESPLSDPVNRDYRPVPSVTADRGVKFFVPWSLARTVGEWNFYKSDTSPQVVLGEHYYMAQEHYERSMYYFIPRNDLTVSACTAADYVVSELEDWIEGALRFDGASRFASLSHADMTRDMTYPMSIDAEGNVQKGEGTYTHPGLERETLDMGENSFLVEVVFRTEPGHRNGVLVSKMDARGYDLFIDGAGALTFLVQADGEQHVGTTRPVNDGAWHHVIAEADRGSGSLRIYLDGRLNAERLAAPSGSCSNTADFHVGRASRGGLFFAGDIDFLRVSRSTLSESKTSIEELYAWEFDGPQLRDFCGNPPVGRRDAGALEAVR